MNTVKVFLSALVIFLPSGFFCQDITRVANHKYSIGLKVIAENSGNRLFTVDRMPVYNGGIQIIRKIGETNFLFETGVYYVTRAIVDGPYTTANPMYSQTKRYSILYRNISIPFNVRIDKWFIYVSGGPLIDFLIKEDISGWKDQNTAVNSKKVNIGFSLNPAITLFRKKDLNVFLEARYSQNVRLDQEAGYHLQPSFKNTGLAVGANYAINKK